MNMQELYDLKKEQEKQYRYGALKSDDKINCLPNFMTVEEISTREDTKGAKEYIEKIIEMLVLFLGIGAYNYDLLQVSIKLKGFVLERTIRKHHENEKVTNSTEKHNLARRHFLDDYVSITFDIEVYEAVRNFIIKVFDNPLNNYIAENVSSKKEFIVKYSELIEMLQQLGYNVTDLPDFTSAINEMSNRRPAVFIFDIDFRNPPQQRILKPQDEKK